MLTSTTTQRQPKTPVPGNQEERKQSKWPVGYFRPVIRGLMSCVPGLRPILSEKGTGGTNSAAYCYGVWLKHLCLLSESGLDGLPETVVELGPGDSLGVGLAAVLCGVRKYYAVDIIRHANLESNLEILDQLVSLITARAPRPTRGWPDYDHLLDERLFPSWILTEAQLKAALDEDRVASVLRALLRPGESGAPVRITYLAPLADPHALPLPAGSVDVVLSHSVMQYAADLNGAYRSMAGWLRPGGMMSHQIDFREPNLAHKWNGFRAFSELHWRAIRGRRRYIINREPYSAHVRYMLQQNCRLVRNLQEHRQDGIARAELAERWRGISDEDLTCCGAFLQAQKIP
jgi:hypothetical protein